VGLLLAVVGVWLAPSEALAWDFMDTRVTWTFGDDDVLARSGEVFPDSPLPGIGDRDGYELFFDNLDSRYTGREHLTHLVMYKRMPSLLSDRLTIEAALVMLFNIQALYGDAPTTNNVLRDDGSYIRLFYGWNTARPTDGLEVVLFPIDTNRFQVGYLYDLSFGGGNIFTRNAGSLTPGLKLQIRVGNFYYFIGMKTAVVRQEVEVPTTEGEESEFTVQFVSETNYGGLTGLGFDATPWFRFDLSGGYFQTGTFPIAGLRAQPVYTYGGAARVVFHQGIPVGMSADFRLYRNDPDADASVGRRGEEYAPGQFSWYLSAEGGIIGQHLSDREVFEGTREQLGYAAALQFRFKFGYLRGHLTGFVRNAPYMLMNTPSLVPFVAVAGEGVTVTPQAFGALGVDYFFPAAHLTLGGMLGVESPPFYEADTSNVGWVLDEHGFRDALPFGDRPYPVIAARLSVQWDLAEFMSVVAALQYVRDANQTRREQTAFGDRLTYQRENQLGFLVTAQARF
jgi:hypothetical protein